MKRQHMRPIVRLATVAMFVLAALGPVSAVNAAQESKLTAAHGQGATRTCWAAECGAPPVPIRLVDPVCYAHEGSQYVPQCQDIYP